MKSSRLFIPAVAVFLAALLFSPALIQNKAAAQEDAVTLGEPDILWLWGEVTAVDAAKGLISVKYLDYDTDTEKEVAIYTDENTSYENVNTIADIKLKDIVSIDYVSGAQGSSLARSISVETPEDVQAMGEATAIEEGPKPAVTAENAIPQAEQPDSVELPKPADLGAQE